MADKSKLLDLLKPFGQEHLLAFWDELNENDQKSLSEEIKSIDFMYIEKLYKKAKADLESVSVKKDDIMECLPKENVCQKMSATSDQLNEWWNTGLTEIAEGRVAVLLLAGGQGTRLGVKYPKGMYDVGLPSHKTLYHLQAERIRRLQTMASEKNNNKDCVIRWYIMTSQATLAATQAYFEQNQYFGLRADDIVFFQQGLLPCLTFDGKLMLATKGTIAKSPDGNGGLYKALVHNKILDDLEKHGVKSVQVYCVDNILVKVADPSFTGFCTQNNLESANKVLVKVKPDEAVGVVCKIDGKFQVVEYSEISKETAEKRADDGSLLYKDANICLHYFTVDFLKKFASEHLEELPHHIAKKKIPCVCVATGDDVKPTAPNGMKLEKFVFDVFQFSQSFSVFEVERHEEFSPVKNAPTNPECSAVSCRTDVSGLHKQFLESAGASFKNADAICEISPLASYGGEDLCAFKGKEFEKPIVYVKDDGKLSPTGSPIAKKCKN